MKIVVLIPSEEYRHNAGARIRYGRLQSPLGELGVELALHDIAAFDPVHADCDVLVVSKCHDARSLVAAAALADRGRLVGVDLFDDYFSQRADSRLERFRGWLRQMTSICQFALCSTPAMAKLATEFRADLPNHVINDPAEKLCLAELPAMLEAKLGEARDLATLRLGWFGVGDNPYFKVGLEDLSAYAAVLAELARGGPDVELTVLTNARSLDVDGLERLARLPVRTLIEEWTEERERDLLSKAFACFIPVNAQAFSAAKSLNRAVTALTAGCQVLSAGYPLYEPLGAFVYRDPAELLHDLKASSMRLSASSLPTYEETIATLASPNAEAAALLGFLNGLSRPDGGVRAPLALIHGHTTNGAAHKSVRALGGLSISSPYCTAQLGFDVIFEGRTGGLAMLVSDSISSRLPDTLRKRLRPCDHAGKKYWCLLDEKQPGGPAEPSFRRGDVPMPFELASYGPTMSRIRERVETLFSPGRVIFSEAAQYPFERQ